jgi:hypothetical protein
MRMAGAQYHCAARERKATMPRHFAFFAESH